LSTRPPSEVDTAYTYLISESHTVLSALGVRLLVIHYDVQRVVTILDDLSVPGEYLDVPEASSSLGILPAVAPTGSRRRAIVMTATDAWWCLSVNFFKFQPCDHTPPRTQRL